MNKFKLLLGLSLLILLSANVQAQSLKMPKMDLSSQLLGVLNDTDGLDLSSDQKSKLDTNNKSFVDDLLKLNGSNASDEDKKAGFLNLKNKRTSFLTELLGNDLFKKYSGKVLKSIGPFKSKLGLAALAF